jgi:transposase
VLAKQISRRCPALLQEHGMMVKLIAPQFVKPYVKSNKNDQNDAEAMSLPTMRFVQVKDVNSKTSRRCIASARS